MKNFFKNMSSETKKKLKKAFLIVFYSLLALFIVFYFKDIDFSLIKDIDIKWGWMLISFVVRMAGLIVLPLSWKIQLDSCCENSLPMGKLYNIFARSWLGRYIPGKVAWIGGKIFFAKQENIDTTSAVVTTFLDGVLQVFCTMLVAVVGFISVGGATGISDGAIFAMYAVTIAIAVVLIPKIFNKLIRIAYKIIKKEYPSERLYIGGGTMIKSISIVTIGKILSGIAGALLICSIYDGITAAKFWYIVAATSMSVAIGMVALFAPAGMGVKEGLQLVLMASIMPKEIALIGVTLNSIHSVVSDILFCFMPRGLMPVKSDSMEFKKPKYDTEEK